MRARTEEEKLMSNEHLNHAYLVDLFANREHCEQLLADTSAFGGPWIQVDDVDSLPPITRGIYVITLVSPYRIESSGRSFGFRNPLYINRTEDVRNIYCAEHVVREEKISELFEAHKFAPFHALNFGFYRFRPSALR